MNTEPAATPAAERARQKRTVQILAVVLMAGGLLVLFVLTRMPLPLRILVGLTDLVGGAVLLLVVRQKFSGR